MDTNKYIDETSQLKLNVYGRYLKEFLLVLTNQDRYKEIFICEPFAGPGYSENNKKGSPIIAVEKIKGFLEKAKEKGINIHLYLNDINKSHYDSLKTCVREYDFVKVYNKEANDFIPYFVEEYDKKNSIGLIFIDPWGYTDVSQENLKKCFKLHIDFLLFIPTEFIYRFVKEQDKSNQSSPARNFCIDMGVDKDELYRCNNSGKVLTLLKNATRTKYNLDFIYDFNLNIGHGAKSQNGLIFTTHHIRGAEKFLIAIDKINDPTIFPMKYPSHKKLTKFLAIPKTNKEIFKWGMKEGHLPKGVNEILKDFEKAGKLNFKMINPIKKRNKNSYYLQENKKNKHIILKIWMNNDLED